MIQEITMKPNNLFELIEGTISEPGDTVHANSHCNALVENPFAWDEETLTDEA